MVSVYIILQGPYRKCFAMSVPLVKLVPLTPLNLATCQKPIYQDQDILNNIQTNIFNEILSVLIPRVVGINDR